MTRTSEPSLTALDRYLKLPPAQIKRALVKAEEAEEWRSGVFHKYKIPDPYERLRSEIAAVLCDGRTGRLKEWAQEMVDGDVRDLAVALVTIACSQLNLALSVAVPFAALLAKRGLKRLCESHRTQKRRSASARS